MADGVPVRGTCKNGHTLDTVAPKGRVTWRGPCPHKACDLSLIASRVKTTARDTTEPPAAAPAGAPKRSYRVVKRYRDEPEPEFRPVDDVDDEPGDGGRGGPGGPAGVREDAPEPPEGRSPPPGSDDVDEPSPEPRRRGRLLRRRRGEPGAAPPGLGTDWVVPGVYR